MKVVKHLGSPPSSASTPKGQLCLALHREFTWVHVKIAALMGKCALSVRSQACVHKHAQQAEALRTVAGFWRNASLLLLQAPSVVLGSRTAALLFASAITGFTSWSVSSTQRQHGLGIGCPKNGALCLFFENNSNREAREWGKAMSQVTLGP